ncbi:DUF6531 domain-containing protein [Kitasatospora griseola]|uniref:DUF6531 domain-containing protein n=1 Tax=Kitasatospora griseola TaxID=2064 RepID=UPI001670D400|nr:DUF6531 domain-containing protein [Kitasatospora griseola]GGR02003.1 type IV secretion protein Rhs [Kitasatospora griseola]
MSNQIVKALEHGAQKLGKTLAEDAGKALKNFYRKAGDNLKTVAKNTREIEAKHAKDLEKIFKGDGKGGVPHPRSGGGGKRGAGSKPLNNGNRKGQGVNGNGRCQTGGDPVDVISGQMITSATDLELPGLLPVVLRRAYASGYVGGRLLGPGWSSTLDQRVEIDADGVHYAGDDAQILHYPLPTHPGQTVHPQAGARWPLTWDRDSGDFLIEDQEHGWTRHFPSAAGPGSGTAFRVGEIRPIVALSDRNGHRIDFLHDDDTLHPVEVRHSGGYHVAVDTVHTADGPRIEELRLLDGTNHGLGTTVVGFRYDMRGRLTDILNSSGQPLIYDWDDQDRITTWTDRNGHGYTYEYGPDGRVAHGRGPDGALDADFGYDTAGRRTTVTDSLGHTTEYHYDEHHHLTAVVDPLGHAVHVDHNPHGQLLAYTDALGNTSRNTLDEQGDVVRVERPDGTTLDVRYNHLHLPTDITTPDGLTWHQSYDERGNRTQVTDRAGATTRFGYDDAGHLTTVTNTAGDTTHVRCDPYGLIAEAVDPLGGRTAYTRDAFGRPTVITDPLGNTTHYQWNTEGQLLSRTQVDGATDTWEYDPEGNLLTRTDPQGATTRIEYTHFHQIAARTEPDGTRYTFTHDTELRLVEVTQPQGLSWTYQHDPAGRLISETDFDGRAVAYRYDPAGRLTERCNALGQHIRYTLDALGRIRTKDAGGAVTEYAYDPAGRLSSARNDTSELTRRHDPVGRILTETVDGRTVEFDYDELGNLTTRRTPSGSLNTWTYDAVGNPTRLVADGHSLSFEHDATGRETTRHLGPELSLAFAWDTTNRLTAQTLTATAGGQLLARAYQYRPDGALTALTDTEPGRPADTTHYELDAAGRVTTVHAADWTETYAYDPAGHLTEASWPARNSTPAQDTRDYQGSLLHRAGRIGYHYDEQGRITARRHTTLSGRTRTWHYTWDAEDRLTEVATPDGDRWAYRYDPLGRRIGKQHLVEADGQWTLREHTEFTWSGLTLIEQTAYGPDLPGPYTLSWDYRGLHPIAQSERMGDGTEQDDVDRRFFAIVTDLVGTPTHLIAPDGTTAWQQRSTLWGVPVSVGRQATDTPLRFPGQYYDPESRLHYNVFRYYDPVAARYLSSDPLGLAPAPDAYGYVPNPLLACDPLGLARNARGQYARDPNAAPVTHNRDSEYPDYYRQSTHDHMIKNWTDEGIAQGTHSPVDASGNPIPRHQLTWRDSSGQVIPPGELTYEHVNPVVNHWNTTGYNSDRATRRNYYNDTSNLEPMTRSQNSSGGARLGQTYRQDVGPNYRCS